MNEMSLVSKDSDSALHPVHTQYAARVQKGAPHTGMQWKVKFHVA